MDHDIIDCFVGDDIETHDSHLGERCMGRKRTDHRHVSERGWNEKKNTYPQMRFTPFTAPSLPLPTLYLPPRHVSLPFALP